MISSAHHRQVVNYDNEILQHQWYLLLYAVLCEVLPFVYSSDLHDVGVPEARNFIKESQLSIRYEKKTMMYYWSPHFT